jgi:TetR/AcrR family tetracycline transcriptional repressor
VLKEALALVDREGADAFSIRRLADHLGVTPMAVYNHVRSKSDLLQGIANAVIEKVEYPSPAGDWRKVVRSCFRALRRACLAHPGAVPLIESADALPAAVFQPMEITLAALQKAGFTPDEALRAHFLLTTFTLGQVSYQSKGWGRGVDAAAAMEEGRIAAATFPAIARTGSLKRWDFDKSFEFGLSTILAGLAASART